ncbi:glycine receptor subunit alphaZ1-like [Glandiceps talaboti]
MSYCLCVAVSVTPSSSGNNRSTPLSLTSQPTAIAVPTDDSLSSSSHGSGTDVHYDLDTDLTKILDDILQNYDMRIRPNAAGPPIVVVTSVYVITGFSTVAATMDYNLMVFIRQRWNDPRLQYNGTAGYSLSVNPKLSDRIWVPDMFFANEKEGKLHDLTVRNEALRIYPNGDILLSMRVSLTLACNMDLRKYPMDVQLCHVTMESYGFRTHDLIFKWSDEEDPIEIDPDIEIPEFRRPDVKTTELNKTYSTGDFTALEAYFVLRRVYDYHILQTYVPTAVYVLISWLSFWINPEGAPARIALGITTVLTVTAQGTGVRGGLPRVAYVKAIDVWMTTCLGFVFAALIEYALVNYLLTEKKRRKDKDAMKAAVEKEYSNGNGNVEMEVLNHNMQPPAKSDDNNDKGEDEESRVFYITTKMVESLNPRSIDRVSRVLFPMVFLIFNMIYWPMCFSGYSDDLLARIDR